MVTSDAGHEMLNLGWGERQERVVDTCQLEIFFLPLSHHSDVCVLCMLCVLCVCVYLHAIACKYEGQKSTAGIFLISSLP